VDLSVPGADSTGRRLQPARRACRLGWPTVPTEKRARQKASRQARMAELRRAQQRRRNLKRGGVVGIAVLIALVLALYSGGVFNGSSKKKTDVATGSSTTTTSVAPTTTVPASVNPRPLSAIEADLIARTPPAKSAGCANPSGKATSTVAAKGNAVATITAPKNVGFPKLDGSAPHYTKFAAAPPFCINADDTYSATMKTTAGTMVIELLPKYAPVTVNNFVFLAGYHYFDGIDFHRVIPGFVDQGGDPTGTGTGGPGYEFADELPKSIGAYDAGALAMANSGANTNGSQFFLIDGAGGAGLTDAYTMYGQVTSGMSVLDKINAGGTSGGTPKILYKITSVTISVGTTPTSTSTNTASTTTASTTTSSTS
jgi:cyclophilin family peptidyl-prolyl cis-trans isomerase